MEGKRYVHYNRDGEMTGSTKESTLKLSDWQAYLLAGGVIALCIWISGLLKF